MVSEEGSRRPSDHSKPRSPSSSKIRRFRSSISGKQSSSISRSSIASRFSARSTPSTRTTGGRPTFKCRSLPFSLTAARKILSISSSSFSSDMVSDFRQPSLTTDHTDLSDFTDRKVECWKLEYWTSIARPSITLGFHGSQNSHPCDLRYPCHLWFPSTEDRLSQSYRDPPLEHDPFCFFNRILAEVKYAGR